MKSILSVIKNILIFLISFLVFIEAGCWFYIRYFNQNIPLPTYQVVDANNKFWGNLDENFGTWHQPGSHYLHNKSCFVVEYRANSLGMRDHERSKQSDQSRAVVMGDSFIEGWGNKLGSRMTDHLENGFDREFLNFATSGTFGTIQQWLQYKTMIKDFDHDVVMIGILPHNDFKDNDLARARDKTKERRPYLDGDYPDFRLIYTQDELRVKHRGPQRLKSFDFTLREWSAFYRVMRFLGSYRVRDFKLTPRWIAEHDDKAGQIKSAYFEYEKRDWEIIRYCLEQLKQEVGDKPLLVFSIATHSDFEERAARNGATAPLTEEFRDLSNELGFIYCDMLEEMAARKLTAEDVFFVCDDHWNPDGNRIAAEILTPYVAKAFQQAGQR